MEGRQFTVIDSVWGSYDLFVITEYPGDDDGNDGNDEGTRPFWGRAWEIFHTNPALKPITDLFSRISYEAYQDALRGHVMPLLRELGPEPEACLLKLGITSEALDGMEGDLLPWASEDLEKGDEDDFRFEVETSALFVYELWRSGVYIIIAPSEDTF